MHGQPHCCCLRLRSQPARLLRRKRPRRAQTPEQSIGRKMDMVIGYSAGGTYDLYARLVARNLSNYMRAIPPSCRATCRAEAAARPVAWLVNVAPKGRLRADDGRSVAGDRAGAGRSADPLRRHQAQLHRQSSARVQTPPLRGNTSASRPSRTRCRRKSPWAPRAARPRRNIRRR